MLRLKEDIFVSDIIGYKSYITNYVQDLDKIKLLSKPYFITLILLKKTNLKLENKKLNLATKLITFQRSFKKNLPVYTKCRPAKISDLKQLKKITEENSSNSRFIKDSLIKKKFKKVYRFIWLKNFFKKKRGDYLFVAVEKKKILGFILVIKEKNTFKIDLILSDIKFRKKKVASSLINTVNNKLMKRNQRIVAGTQYDNYIAIKMYKKLKFLRNNKIKYIYHIHSKRN